MVNITNHCNLSCTHCFIYREGNPNQAPASIRAEMSDADMLETLAGLRERHGIASMLWMGGEPLLKRRFLAEGVRLFARNTITTNGTVPLVDFGPAVHYVVSLDGPEDLNDELRGKGTFRRVLRKDDASGSAWESNAERAGAVREVLRLKARHGGFVRNSTRSLELMLPPACEAVTARCPAQDSVLPLWLEGDHFVTPFCCYGNDVDCSRCGAWVVFHLAARLDRGETLVPAASADQPAQRGWFAAV